MPLPRRRQLCAIDQSLQRVGAARLQQPITRRPALGFATGHRYQRTLDQFREQIDVAPFVDTGLAHHAPRELERETADEYAKLPEGDLLFRGK